MVNLSSPVRERHGNTVRLTATVRVRDRELPLWYESTGVELVETSEPFLPLALSVAMRLNQPLHIEGAISRQAVDSAMRWQPAQHGYLPELVPVSIDAPRAQAALEAKPPQAALFFSGGVDSFYTLFDRAETIGSLVLVQGFDIKTGDEPLYGLAQEAARAVAAGFGKRLILVRTNLRLLMDAYLGWAEHAFAPALAATAFLLNRQAGHFLLAGEYIGDARRHASHPDVDPLWSTPALSLECHGDSVQRVRKLERLKDHPLPRRFLRVCWSAPGVYNCCRCSKCLRTMAGLHALGVLEHFTSFPQPLRLDLLRRQNLPGVWPQYHEGLKLTLELARQRGGDAEFVSVLRRAYWRHRIQYALMTTLHPVAYDMLRRVIWRD